MAASTAIPGSLHIFRPTVTIVKLLIEACQKYGTPCRLRSDKGGENVFVALLNLINGENRYTHITGRSMHNQRIERIRKYVFNLVIKKYYNIFITWRIVEFWLLKAIFM